MKNSTGLCARVVGLFYLMSTISLNANTYSDSLSFYQIMVELKSNVDHQHANHLKKQNELIVSMKSIDLQIAHTAGRKKKKHLQSLQHKINLQNQLQQLDMQMDVSQLKIRYRKGIDLIRLMYEKILGLDHHFTGLHTYQHINVLSNPHSYPTFQKTQEILKKNKNRKYNMQLPSLLNNNPFIAATYTMVSVLMGENSSKEKEEEMENIACILDFTVRMNSDLNVIRNETEYLKKANQGLKKDCEKLFAEYTKSIGYLVKLEDTRTNDDWGALSNKLDDRIREMETDITTNGNLTIHTSRLMVDLEFATQRVIDFINQYSNFIEQGTQYYQKFDSIISTYQYEDKCEEELPRQFGEMKSDIKSTIEKFENTYDLPELQGSRLKDLMFGVTP